MPKTQNDWSYGHDLFIKFSYFSVYIKTMYGEFSVDGSDVDGFWYKSKYKKIFYTNHVDLIIHFDLLAMISLFGLSLLLSIHNSLHSVFALVFCLSFFLKGKHFVMLTKKIFPSNRNARRNDSIFTWAYFIWILLMRGNFIHCLFRKIFCNILIQKFQNYSPRIGCLALCMTLAKNNYWCKKYCNFLLLWPVINTHLQDHFLIAA